MKHKKQERVFVGLSGGVDSSVAALRLIEAGYDVYGVFIKVWHPDWLKCNWEQERLDAMRVAAKLDIPFLTCDAEEQYKNEVADYFVSEYTAGRTPNPDVMCNKAVKFGAFLEFATSSGADYIATGHYAQIHSVDNRFTLLRGKDTNKDQSYFLWPLTQSQLAKTLFPVGDTPKNKIRQEAKEANLLTSDKKDSQGICFLGHINIPEFLSHYTELTPGPVLNQDGDVVGEHQGALVYTKGQRHGFTFTGSTDETKPHYVVERNLDTNTVTVSEVLPTEPKGEQLRLSHINLIEEKTALLTPIEIQTRYRQKPIQAQITKLDSDKLTLELLQTSESVSEGQSCVLYSGDRCLGGGIISDISYASKST